MRKLRRYLPFFTQFPLIGLIVSLIACNSPGGSVDGNVATQHNDNYRTGAYLAETTLTPDKVKQQGMQIRYWISPGDGLPSTPPGQPASVSDGGWILTQLLYVRNVPFRGGTANGLFAATLGLKINAFIADNGIREWVADLTTPEPDPCREPRALDATPVIDVDHLQMFAVFSTQAVQHRLGCAFDVSPTATEKFLTHAPIRFFLASISLVDGSISLTRQIRARDDRTGQEFSGDYQNAHPGLLLDQGSVYVAFGSNSDLEPSSPPFQGWVMRYNEGDLTLQNAFCTSCASPSSAIAKQWQNGGGVWQAGGGLAADNEGSVYFLTGNGITDFQRRLSEHGFVENHMYGDSIVKLAINGNKMTPAAFAPEEATTPDSAFTPPADQPLPPYGCGMLCEHDADLGSGGAMLIPQTNLVIGGGKTGVMYVLDRGSMAAVQQFDASTNQYHPEFRWQDWDVGPHLHGSPTYWHPDGQYGYLYVWGEKDYLKMYRFDTTTARFEIKPPSPISGGGAPRLAGYKRADILAHPYTMPGGMISLSADGNKTGTGIVWATLPLAPCLLQSQPCFIPKQPFPVALYAFNAETLELLWNDASFTMPGAHWAPPTIADGKVFLPLQNGIIVVYELCQPGMPCTGSSTPIKPQVFPISPNQKTVQLHDLFPNEGAIRGFVRIALNKIALDRKFRQDSIFNGHGFQIYEAVREQTGNRRLIWKATETVEELAEFRDPASPQKREPVVKIRIAKGSKWSADDGSTAMVTAEKTASAPISTDAPWMLFKIVTSRGQGILSTHSFIQRVYTDGGAPPAAPPKKPGQIVRVPFRAQYWMYH